MADPTEISPYLLSFLLNQVGSSGSKRETTAGLLPGEVAEGVFNGIQSNQTGAYNFLSTVKNARANKRADSDALYAIRLQKKQIAEANAAEAKRQAALQKQLKALMAKNNSTPKNPNIKPSKPTPNLNNIIPKSPNPNLPGPSGNGDISDILPKIAPESGGGQGKGPSNETHIKPAPDCPLWKKLLRQC